MKILILTYSFLPDVGGTEMVAYDYASILTEKGHEVTVMSKLYPNSKTNYPFKHIQIPNTFGDSLWLFNFGLYIKKNDLDIYDCIILNQCHTPLVAGHFFNKKLFAKTITLIQGLEVESIYTKSNNFFCKIYSRILRHDFYHRKCLLNCRKVVSVSEFHKNKVMNAANLREYSQKFQVVYTGIDKETFCHVDTDFKCKYQLGKKEILISVSRIEQMKGYDEMLNVFRKLIKVNKDYMWIIIGDGSYYNTLVNKIKEYSLQENILLLGSIKRDELRYYYSVADCFWLLSNYDECLPLVYLEAQSCGIPVIGRNKGGVRETVVDNQTGFLVNDDDECMDILLNKSYKEILPSKLKKFIDGFDKNLAADKILT